jgi:hypothetical protein
VQVTQGDVGQPAGAALAELAVTPAACPQPRLGPWGKAQVGSLVWGQSMAPDIQTGSQLHEATALTVPQFLPL